MEVTQTIKLDDKERIVVAKTIGLCERIADVCGDKTSVMDVFDYLMSNAKMVDEYCYSVPDILQIAEIG